MNGNDFMAWVLRSPAYGFLSGMMLITVTGCKTGKKYTLPVEYFEEDGYLWVVSNRNRTWWRNLRNGAEVELLLRHKPAHAFAELVTECGRSNHTCVIIYVMRRWRQSQWEFGWKISAPMQKTLSALPVSGFLCE